MTKEQVQVGETYEAKVGARWVEVRIEGQARGGWNARSVRSGKPIRITDPQRCRPSAAAATDNGTAGRGKAKRTARNVAAKPEHKLGCLDAAAEVLKEANESLQCKAMVARMQEQGLWTTTAPTPHATLYSAILREMTIKGASQPLQEDRAWSLGAERKELNRDRGV
jgi:hypothetical protein